MARIAAQAFGPSQPTLDHILRWIVKTFAFVLGASTVGLLIVIALDAFTDGVEQTHVQIMLTAFTTVAGILAGFLTGQALGKPKKTSRFEPAAPWQYLGVAVIRDGGSYAASRSSEAKLRCE